MSRKVWTVLAGMILSGTAHAAKERSSSRLLGLVGAGDQLLTKAQLAQLG
jgi:hypothetical protein